MGWFPKLQRLETTQYLRINSWFGAWRTCVNCCYLVPLMETEGEGVHGIQSGSQWDTTILRCKLTVNKRWVVLRYECVRVATDIWYLTDINYYNYETNVMFCIATEGHCNTEATSDCLQRMMLTNQTQLSFSLQTVVHPFVCLDPFGSLNPLGTR